MIQSESGARQSQEDIIDMHTCMKSIECNILAQSFCRPVFDYNLYVLPIPNFCRHEKAIVLVWANRPS